MARYVQDKIGMYPHLPVVLARLNAPPFPGVEFPMLAMFGNESNPKFTFDPENTRSFGNIDPNCSLDLINKDKVPADISMNISAGLAADSSYPPEIYCRS